MLVAGDVVGLEVWGAAELSGDKILHKELAEGQNIHTNNQEAFGLPSRLIAKILKFRILYGGSAYAFAQDPDFMEVSTSVKYWERAIDAYYTKYSGIAAWHSGLLDCVRKTGFIEIPSGRVFRFEPKQTWRGLDWPLTTIKNYPVQGLGADLVMLARIELQRLIDESGLEALIVMTVHDSLVVDTPSVNVSKVAEFIHQAIAKVPDLAYNNWQHRFSLPLHSEISVGRSKAELEVFNNFNKG